MGLSSPIDSELRGDEFFLIFAVRLMNNRYTGNDIMTRNQKIESRSSVNNHSSTLSILQQWI